MTGLIGRFDIDAAIVDLDGTLVDTLGDFCVALNRMLADLPAPFCGQTVDRASVALLVGKGSEHLLKSVLALVNDCILAINIEAPALTPTQLDQLYEHAWSRYQHHYEAINGQHSDVYVGAREGLAGLKKQGLKLACLTNKPTLFAKTLLQAKGLDGFFEFTFGGDAFDRKKPDPLPLFKTCEAMGTTPARTLMIGDSSNDAKAARAAGCPVLLVTYGYNHGEPVQAVDADGLTDSLENLLRA